MNFIVEIRSFFVGGEGRGGGGYLWIYGNEVEFSTHNKLELDIGCVFISCWKTVF